MADSTQTKEQKADLKAAQAAAPSDDELRDIAARVPPLIRDDEHSFVSADDTDEADLKVDDVQPNITTEGIASPELDTITITRPDNAKSTYERSSAVSEVDLERMSDSQIKQLSGKVTGQIPVARLGQSDRPRQPDSRVPAAGAGTWPMNESQMPAVLPSDPPVESADDRDLGDVTFKQAAGFSTSKDGTLVRGGLKIGKKDVAAAAAVYARLRQQFPHFNKDQLADEFEVQWLSIRSGAEQSHRAGPELSGHGQTAVGDARVTEVPLGKLRAKSDRAFEADPSPAPGAAPIGMETGLPTANEPASVAPDQAKEPSGEAGDADVQAQKEFKKFDHDGDGRPGGSKPKAS